MIVNFLCSINFMSLMTTTSAYAIEAFGSSHGAAGFAVSVIVIGALAARLFVVRYSLAVGYKQMLTIGLAAITVSTFAYFLAGNFLLFCLVRFVNGLAFGVSANTTTTFVTTIIPKSRSGEGVGYFSLSQIVGTAVGPYFAINMLHNGGFTGVFLFAAIAPALSLPLLFFLKNPINIEAYSIEEKNLSFFDKTFERKVLPISLLCFLVYFGYSSVLSFVAVFAAEIGLERTAAYLFVVYALALIVTRPFVSKLFDRRGPSVILYPGIAILASGLLLLSGTETNPALIVSGILFGVGLGAIQAGTLALAVSLVPRRRLAVANGTYYMSLDAATSIGPSVTGLIIAFAGFRNMYFVMFLIIALCIPLYRLLIGRIRRNLIN